ncbi:MAG TPA: histidine triad nucleotide-binding protein [bacterium]|nr:histidine triad nucleotide-binding protein [bacterium]
MIYEDDDVVAFKDLNPQAPTHVLVVPRKHIPSLNELTPQNSDKIGKMLLAAQKIATDYGHAESGYRVVFNCNHDGGQTVFHVHCHVLGGRQMHWPPG